MLARTQLGLVAPPQERVHVEMLVGAQ
jgi:hypothetical protein